MGCVRPCVTHCVTPCVIWCVRQSCFNAVLTDCSLIPVCFDKLRIDVNNCPRWILSPSHSLSSIFALVANQKNKWTVQEFFAQDSCHISLYIFIKPLLSILPKCNVAEDLQKREEPSVYSYHWIATSNYPSTAKLQLINNNKRFIFRLLDTYPIKFCE